MTKTTTKKQQITSSDEKGRKTDSSRQISN